VSKAGVTIFGVLLALTALMPSAVAEPASPAELAAQRAANSGRLLFNDTFSEWQNDQPTAWVISDPEAVTKGAEAETGAALLSAKPVNSDFVDIRQNPNPALCLPGDVLIFEVDCYSDDAGSVEAVLRVNHSGDKRIITREAHPGGGWAKLRAVCPVPEAELSLVECRIRVIKGAETPVRLRSAQANIVPAIP